jgi:molecular chaperone GrpE
MSETKAEDSTMQPGETGTTATPDASNAAGDTLSTLPTAEEWTAMKAQASRGAEAQERYVRLYADFENFKKRAARERDEVRRAATEGVLGRLLPVLDTFEMAMQAAAMPLVNLETLKAGVSMIQGQLRNAVAEYGVEEINAVGQTFDPLIHEAVSELVTSEAPDGQVVSQSRKGFRVKDRLLRPASVVVARRPSAAGETVPEAQSAS